MSDWARKVKLQREWNSERRYYETEDSEREYWVYTVVTTEVEDSDEYGYYRGVGSHTNGPRNTEIYVDDETGLITTDVEKFEKWIKGVIVSNVDKS